MPTRTRSRLEEELGLRYYYTDWPGVGGRIREKPEDFIVEEILLDGSVARVDEPLRRPDTGTSHTWIHVVKTGVDTIRMARALARALGVRLSDVGLGGLKDARAVTAQVVSVPGRVEPPAQLLGGRVRVLSHWYADRPMTSREILGNRFRVVIRGVTGDPGPLRCAPNYYGHQRFGTVRPVSHLLGEALARRDPGQFLHIMFCLSFPGESPRARRVREMACDGDYAGALAEAPKGMAEERAVLRALLRTGDPHAAVAKLPRLVKMVYLEAYQARLFNELLSTRIEQGPLEEPIPGDLVAILDHHGLPTRHVIDVTHRNLDTARRLVKAGRAAVVVTVPGPGARLPRNLRGTIDEPRFDTEWLGIKLRGDYRPACAEPRDYTWKRNSDTASVSFTLPRGSYATAILREIMKPEDPATAGY